MKNLLLTLILGSFSTFVFGQNVGINTTGAIPDPSAALDIDYTDKGLLIPRVSLTSTTDILTVPSPVTSLLVYNNNVGMTGGAVGFWYWDGTAWIQALGPQGPIGLTGVAGANGAVGAQGPIGLTGVAGANGAVGAQGPIGLTGPAGANGAVGAQGPIGLTGVAGAVGAQGPIGLTGPQGPNWTLTTPSFNTNGTMVVNGTAGSGGPVTSTQAAWLTTGNAGVAATNFIGPTNNVDLKFRTNNTEKMTVEANGNVGINKTVPTERLDVVGNVRFSGALMPNNQAGAVNQMLLSGGPGVAPTWGQTMLNPGATTAMGKFFSGTFNINDNATLTLTITDANCVTTSTCTTTFVGPLPIIALGNPNYGRDLEITAEAQAGQWVFHIANNTGFNLTNFEFSFFAAY